MPGHSKRAVNARIHDARTLRAIAARMQTRGDSFALADSVIAVASELTRRQALAVGRAHPRRAASRPGRVTQSEGKRAHSYRECVPLRG